MLAIEASDKKKAKPVERVFWPATGFVTIKQILGANGGPIPVSASRWWLGVKTGEFPQPLKVGGRTVWRVSDIDELVAGLSSRGAPCRARGRSRPHSGGPHNYPPNKKRHRPAKACGAEGYGSPKRQHP